MQNEKIDSNIIGNAYRYIFFQSFQFAIATIKPRSKNALGIVKKLKKSTSRTIYTTIAKYPIINFLQKTLSSSVIFALNKKSNITIKIIIFIANPYI